jgi:predicted RNA-binding Zn-ribbon protein involved in translation (DUF1610 family)
MLNHYDQEWATIRPTGQQSWLYLSPMTSARFVLEDHAGYPIECPICGRVDLWRMQRAAGTDTPRAFVCSHSRADGHGGISRWTASVAAEQVGGYLDPATLLSTAA